MSTNDTALVTGANSGIGFHAAARLAGRGYRRVVLVARTQKKADAARARLVQETGLDPFEALAADMGDFASVEAAAAALIETGDPLDYVLLNAGTIGPATLDRVDQGVELAMASSLVGHHILATRLLEAGIVRAGGTVVIAGSEAARGDMPTMTLTDVPAFARRHTEGDLEEAVAAILCARTPYAYAPNPQYAMVKVFVAWWAQALARRLDEGIRVVAVSPGGTSATGVFKNQPYVLEKLLTWFLVPLMEWLGKVHSVDTAVDRYLAPLDWEAERSGEFWASKPGTGNAVGPLEQMTHPHLLDIDAQEALWSALGRLTGANLGRAPGFASAS